MKIGETLHLGTSLTDENMVYLRQLGTNYLLVWQGESGKAPLKGKKPLVSKLMESKYYKAEDLIALKKWVKSHGLDVYALAMRNVVNFNKIIMGESGRDEQIEYWCKSIRSQGKAEIPISTLNWVFNTGSWMPFWRTSVEPVGRGGTKISRFDYEVAKKVPITGCGKITDKMMWDSLIYFLKAVIPVAEESGVQLVMHPSDPPVPSLAGVARIMRSVKAFNRLFQTFPSASNKMVFCLGCFAPVMEPDDVYDAISHFARDKRIGYVHFRNVKGTVKKFEESYPDDGRLDMLKVIKVLKEAGYKEPIFLDHIPRMTNDTEFGHISRAFQIGYLKGVLRGADAAD